MSNTQNATQPAPGAETKAKTAKHNPWKKVIILAAILLIVLLVTNPSLMFFLPASWREAM